MTAVQADCPACGQPEQYCECRPRITPAMIAAVVVALLVILGGTLFLMGAPA